MTTRGRKPDPEAVKAIKGNTRRQRKPSALAAEDQAAAPEIKTGGAKAPSWLITKARVQSAAAKRTNELAAQMWEKLQPELSRMNFLKSTDDPILGRFCRYMAEWVAYNEIIDREGAYYTTESPHVKDLRRPHPAFNARKVVEQALGALGGDLGLSPAARQRIMLQLAAGLGGPGDRPTQPGELPMVPPAPPMSPIGMLGMGSRPH